MSHALKITLLFLAFVLFVMTASLTRGAQVKSLETKLPAFSAKDRQVIEAYYKNVAGGLAPGSINRSPFSPDIERVLVIGSHVPMQLEKDLKPLPEKLESQLTQSLADYRAYALGRHVVLVRKSDMVIADIIRNVAVQ